MCRQWLWISNSTLHTVADAPDNSGFQPLAKNDVPPGLQGWWEPGFSGVIQSPLAGSQVAGRSAQSYPGYVESPAKHMQKSYGKLANAGYICRFTSSCLHTFWTLAITTHHLPPQLPQTRHATSHEWSSMSSCLFRACRLLRFRGRGHLRNTLEAAPKGLCRKWVNVRFCTELWDVLTQSMIFSRKQHNALFMHKRSVESSKHSHPRCLIQLKLLNRLGDLRRERPPQNLHQLKKPGESWRSFV